MWEMCKKFVYWFVFFGGSLLLEAVGVGEQGKVFFYTFFGINIVSIFQMIISILIIGIDSGRSSKVNEIVLYTTVICLFVVFATWGATKIFNIDFYVAYQIMTFGQLLTLNNNEKTIKNQ